MESVQVRYRLVFLAGDKANDGMDLEEGKIFFATVGFLFA